ncbi:MAG: hypothetical protein ACRDF5_02670 [bacterium]
MIAPRHLASGGAAVRPLRSARRRVHHHGPRHQRGRGSRPTPVRAPGLISLWLDDRRALPLKWGLLALLLLGVALLERPL